MLDGSRQPSLLGFPKVSKQHLNCSDPGRTTENLTELGTGPVPAPHYDAVPGSVPTPFASLFCSGAPRMRPLLVGQLDTFAFREVTASTATPTSGEPRA